MAPTFITLAVVDRLELHSLGWGLVALVSALTAAYDVRTRWRDVDGPPVFRLLTPTGGARFGFFPTWLVLAGVAVGSVVQASRAIHSG